MVKTTMFEIYEITELGRQVWEIVEDDYPQNKVVVVDVSEWEVFEKWQSAQQDAYCVVDTYGCDCPTCQAIREIQKER